MAWRKLGDLDACCITLRGLAPIVERFEVLNMLPVTWFVVCGGFKMLCFPQGSVQ
jgi:hypothetical protein